jgi:phospholipase/carboxylesterase
MESVVEMADDYAFVEQVGAAADAPVLFLFHGTGGNEHQFLDLGAQLVPAARRIAPRGDVSEGGAPRYFKRHAEGVFDMEDLARATRKMAGFVRERLSVNAVPVETIGLGYSNGANILAAVQFAEPALFDVAVLLHPMIPFDPAPQPRLAGKRVLITAGRRDAICPADETQKLADWYVAQGADVRLFWHEGGHEIRREEIAAVADFLRR